MPETERGAFLQARREHPMAASLRLRPEFAAVRDRVIRRGVSEARAAAELGGSSRTLHRALAVDGIGGPAWRGERSEPLRERPEFGPMRDRLMRGEISQRRAAAELDVARSALQEAMARDRARTEPSGAQVSLNRPSSVVMPAAPPRTATVHRGLEVAR
jgi:hypothetical protein